MFRNKKASSKFIEFGNYYVNLANVECMTCKDGKVAIYMKTQYIMFSPADGLSCENLYHSMKKQIEAI